MLREVLSPFITELEESIEGMIKGGQKSKPDEILKEPIGGQKSEPYEDLEKHKGGKKRKKSGKANESSPKKPKKSGN